MDYLNISIIVPVYSGENYLLILTESILAINNNWNERGLPLRVLEIIFVNDNAIDGSYNILKKLEKKYDIVRIINLSKNFGQHAATISGILHTSGDWIVTLDEDLQHNPIYIEHMLLYAFKNNLDIVYGKPSTFVHKNFYRDRASKLIKYLINKTLNTPHIQQVSSFRLIRGSVARSAASLARYRNYFDIILHWFSDNISSFTVQMEDIRFNQKNKSGYNLIKLLIHAKNMFFTAQTRVPDWTVLLGFFGILISIFLSIIVLFKKIISPESIQIAGWTSLMITILFFSALILFIIGLSFEYLIILYEQIQGRPVFCTINRDKDKHFFEIIKKVKL